jgi:dTDP-4-dehydrorhamnose 3,5-epimerase
MQFQKLALEGCYAIQTRFFQDERGWFLKPYFTEGFEAHQIFFKPRENFISESHSNVLRGMHFQLPPKDHQKLVFCLKGKILDVGLDLRKSSQTFGKFFTQELSPESTQCVFMPKGFAHGFYSLTAGSIVGYLTDESYSQQHDTGIRWDSFGMIWPNAKPLLSQRDQGFVGLDEFKSPFS